MRRSALECGRRFGRSMWCCTFCVVAGLGLSMRSEEAFAQQAPPAAPASTQPKRYLQPLRDPTVKPDAANDVGAGQFLQREQGGGTDPIVRIYADYPSVRSSLGRLMGDRRDPAFRDPEGKVVAFEVLKNGDVLFGPNVGIARRALDAKLPDAKPETDPQHSSPIDFYWDARDRKLHVRSILLTENGDPADLAFRRAGDETYPYGPPMPVKSGMNLGAMYWMGWGDNNEGFQSRSAQISATAAEDIKPGHAGGTLRLATTAVGGTRPVDRVVIANDGRVGFGTPKPEAPIHIATDATGQAEDYPSAETLEPGDVVAVDAGASVLTVKRSAAAYEQGVIGIVTAKAAIRVSRANSGFTGRGPGDAIEAGYPVAHGGRVEVKVSAENGEIRPGDYLAASSTPGVAMKATAKGAVVGKALQPYAGAGVGRVQALVNVTWYVP